MERAIVDTSSGQIIIRKDVIAEYAGHVAISTTGIVGMAMISMKDGVYKLLKKILALSKFAYFCFLSQFDVKYTIIEIITLGY